MPSAHTQPQEQTRHLFLSTVKGTDKDRGLWHRALQYAWDSAIGMRSSKCVRARKHLHVIKIGLDPARPRHAILEIVHGDCVLVATRRMALSIL